jgi:hypothetical protein
MAVGALETEDWRTDDFWGVALPRETLPTHTRTYRGIMRLIYGRRMSDRMFEPSARAKARAQFIDTVGSDGVACPGTRISDREKTQLARTIRAASTSAYEVRTRASRRRTRMLVLGLAAGGAVIIS